MTRAAGALAVAGLLGVTGIACSSSGSSAKTDSSTTVEGAAKGSTPSTAGANLDFKSLDAGGPVTIGAMKSGTIDIGEFFSVSPAIVTNGWQILTDDKQLQAADNFVPLIRTDKVTKEITAVLDAVDGRLTQSGIATMIDEVSNKGQNPDDVAKDWLANQKLPGSLKATGTLTVGSNNFAESEIVGQIYAQALEQAGVKVTMKPDFGTRQATMPAMEKGSLDLMPEFTASLLLYLDPNAKVSGDLAQVEAALAKAVAPKGLTALKATDVSDVNVFVVTKATAKKYNLKTLSDLAKVKDTLTLGGPPECAKNAQCLPGLEKTYGLKFNVK